MQIVRHRAAVRSALQVVGPVISALEVYFKGRMVGPESLQADARWGRRFGGGGGGS